MRRQHHLHLEVVRVKVHPELERAKELPVGVVARELQRWRTGKVIYTMAKLQVMVAGTGR